MHTVSVIFDRNHGSIFAEILWGHRFEPLVSFKKELGEYSVDYSLFNSFYEVDTPLCSGEELDELQAVEQDLKREGDTALPAHLSCRVTLITLNYFLQV